VKRLACTLALVLVLLSSASVASAAVDRDGLWLNKVKLNSLGPKGLRAEFHIAQRHPGPEYNLVSINGLGGANNTYTGFGWEITDAHYEPWTSFQLFLHVKWPSGADSYYWYGPISANAWHELKVAYNGNGTWGCYSDGTLVKTATWDYYQQSTTWCFWQLETNPYSPVPSTAYFGHPRECYLKANNGNWYKLTSGWSVSPSQNSMGVAIPGSDWPNPFQTQYHSRYYDWEGDLP
jgi:hypothetical protein